MLAVEPIPQICFATWGWLWAGICFFSKPQSPKVSLLKNMTKKADINSIAFLSPSHMQKSARTYWRGKTYIIFPVFLFNSIKWVPWKKLEHVSKTNCYSWTAWPTPISVWSHSAMDGSGGSDDEFLQELLTCHRPVLWRKSIMVGVWKSTCFCAGGFWLMGELRFRLDHSHGKNNNLVKILPMPPARVKNIVMMMMMMMGSTLCLWIWLPKTVLMVAYPHSARLPNICKIQIFANWIVHWKSSRKWRVKNIWL